MYINLIPGLPPCYAPEPFCREDLEPLPFNQRLQLFDTRLNEDKGFIRYTESPEFTHALENPLHRPLCVFLKALGKTVLGLDETIKEIIYLEEQMDTLLEVTKDLCEKTVKAKDKGARLSVFQELFKAVRVSRTDLSRKMTAACEEEERKLEELKRETVIPLLIFV